MASSAPTVPGSDTTDPVPTEPGPTEPEPTEPPTRRPRRFIALLAAVATLLLIAVVAAGLDDRARDTPAGTPQPVPDRLAASIAQAQDRLRRLPDDAGTWASLGSAYVEQARVSANPAYYAQAQGALERSMALQPTGNAAAAVGLGALANARHDFATARTFAEQALELNPASVEANGVLADAATQLGDTATATAAVQQMLDLRPGVAAFTRASYELELHGRVDEARAALQRALDAATSRDEIAFSHYYLGELAWGGGEVEEARAAYERGLAAAPGDPMLLQGRAKVLAASGRVDEAIIAYQRLTERVPLPQYLLEYGELLESAGRLPAAQAQYRLLAEQQRLYAAQGSVDDVAAAQLAADHGDPAEAVRLAEAEWQRRQSIFSADALAWALHAAGRDAEALPLIERAGSLGRRDATVDYHRGMILAGLSRTDPGRTGEAIAALDRALATNPYFSPLHAVTARQTLDALRGRS
jgi:tetratricopeptide (TPR) repeat protein